MLQQSGEQAEDLPLTGCRGQTDLIAQRRRMIRMWGWSPGGREGDGRGEGAAQISRLEKEVGVTPVTPWGWGCRSGSRQGALVTGGKVEGCLQVVTSCV